MGTSFSKKIIVDDYNVDLNELIEKTFIELRWRYNKVNNNYFEANVKMGLKSNGENVSVNTNSDNEILVKSKLKFGLIDWGKNQNNVQMFEKTLRDILQHNSKNDFDSSTKDIIIDPYDEESFINKINKLNKLLLAQILTEEEFQNKKLELINDLNNVKNTINREDFLISLIPLKNNNILTQDEILKIKNILNN